VGEAYYPSIDYIVVGHPVPTLFYDTKDNQYCVESIDCDTQHELDEDTEE
jgi:hypothetical protein